jgi:uncharacterized protein
MHQSGLTPDEFQAAIENGELATATCRSCGGRQAFPAPSCFRCGSTDLGIERHDGSGRIFSWVVNHHAFAPEYEGQPPYTVVLVELAAGGRVYGRLEGGDNSNATIAANMQVRLVASLTRERKYPVYALA